MKYHSRSVSGQSEAIHPSLADTVLKHVANPFQKPLQPHNQAAVHFIIETWEQRGKPAIILDSGCGTGGSTFNLAMQYPSHLVVGIDQSLHRLSKAGVTHPEAVQSATVQASLQDNVCLVRGDLVDCWPLLLAHRLPIAKHFILYPNPWPKKKHLQRRWHGHPVFPDLLQLCDHIELRSNWKTYVDEFAVAAQLAASERLSTAGIRLLQLPSADCQNAYLTPFEKKYSLSGQPLYRLETGPK